MTQLGAHFIPFSAQTRISGVNLQSEQIRKGAVDAVVAHVRQVKNYPNMPIPKELERQADEIAKTGGTPLAVARNGNILGVIHLKDIVKGGIRERFAELRRPAGILGIRGFARKHG
jgi:K+-transporting ATPase ATPase B chain